MISNIDRHRVRIREQKKKWTFAILLASKTFEGQTCRPGPVSPTATSCWLIALNCSCYAMMDVRFNASMCGYLLVGCCTPELTSSRDCVEVRGCWSSAGDAPERGSTAFVTAFPNTSAHLFIGKMLLSGCRPCAAPAHGMGLGSRPSKMELPSPSPPPSLPSPPAL